MGIWLLAKINPPLLFIAAQRGAQDNNSFDLGLL